MRCFLTASPSMERATGAISVPEVGKTYVGDDRSAIQLREFSSDFRCMQWTYSLSQQHSGQEEHHHHASNKSPTAPDQGFATTEHPARMENAPNYAPAFLSHLSIVQVSDCLETGQIAVRSPRVAASLSPAAGGRYRQHWFLIGADSA